MSGEQQPPDAAGDVRDGPMPVAAPNGGALMRGGNVRPFNPTPADVSALARKRVYQLIPKLVRIGLNAPKRVTKGKNKGKLSGKPPYSVANQIKAIAELRLLAQDRMLSEAQVRDRLMQLVDKTYQVLPPELAKAYLKEIGPLFADL